MKTHRQSERKPMQIAVTLVIEGEEENQIASSQDLSQHGMRLQTESSLELGQRVGLLLGDDPDSVVYARVVWIGKADSEQSGQVGLAFLGPMAALPV